MGPPQGYTPARQPGMQVIGSSQGSSQDAAKQDTSSSSRSHELPGLQGMYKAPPLKPFPGIVERVSALQTKTDSEVEDLRHVAKSRMVEEVKMTPRAVTFQGPRDMDLEEVPQMVYPSGVFPTPQHDGVDQDL